MDDTEGFGRDPCEEFLQSQFPVPVDGDRQRMLLLRTTRALRRRRRWKRLGLVAALAASYAAGVGTLWLCQATSPGTPAPQVTQQAADPVPKSPAVATLPPLVEDVGTPAVLLETLALNSETERGHLFRLAGRRYVEEAGDLSAALRCYREYLNGATAKDLAISVEQDDFLLMALKIARQKEREHGKTGG